MKNKHFFIFSDEHFDAIYCFFLKFLDKKGNTSWSTCLHRQKAKSWISPGYNNNNEVNIIQWKILFPLRIIEFREFTKCSAVQLGLRHLSSDLNQTFKNYLSYTWKGFKLHLKIRLGLGFRWDLSLLFSMFYFPLRCKRLSVSYPFSW